MITLEDFIDKALDTFYKVNIFYNNTGVEILHQVEIENLIDELEKIGCLDLMLESLTSWDINEEKELTLNIG